MYPERFWRKLQGETVNNEYYLQEYLGCGAYGAVYKADQVIIDQFIREIAIKLIALEEDETKAKKQLNELIAAANLQHENIIRTYTVGTCEVKEDKYLFIVMEIATITLEKKLKTGKLSTTEAREIVKATAAALHYLHNLSPRKVHRDIKPANLLYADNKWKVSDLGLLREIGTNSLRTQDRRGTPFYAPPESYKGVVGTASDIWSLGIMTAEILTGSLPFTGKTDEEVMKKTLDEQPEIDWSKISEPFTAIVRGCLEKERENRWTAEQVLTALAPKQGLYTPTKETGFFPKSVDNNEESDKNPVSEPILASAFINRINQLLASIPEPAPQPKKQTQTFDFKVITVNNSGETIKTEQRQAEYLSENLGRGVSLEMVQIPGGTFMMGAPDNEQGGCSDESPQHRVTVPTFFAGKYAITQAQWEAVMGNNPSRFKGEKRPVENVSWDDAVKFCKKLSQTTGKTYRLLSEAEWEYACRAHTTTPFHFGETITPELVNYDGNNPYAKASKGLYRKETTDVGSFPPNAFGLYDMHGNVWEWCSDKWHDNYNGAPTDGSSWETGGSEYRVQRGGSWFNNAVDCRSAIRNRNSAGIRCSNFGFRVALASA
ncbi:bifunctional serine/threonine-protein kinase/formylglycine-generating enzyme family protein [Microcoleus sp. CAWBG640]|uniref:bifunctional serine/threonine-protein kinase/formylglycine-generating enzyme family protein n=1 Tax=Microcoleus sp. CAWBG640 TaxID=2841653 RepID=UPI00312B8D9F